ncbi:MAG: acylphosphatase [Candidatus Altiarchaeota archaeon]|nr:acylphosphatase [Candidatus Altiarchaeota archaeon]
MERAHAYISGRVQGVFFRANTQDKAVALGLTGWVRNMVDGRVEAVFEGEKERVDEMLKWCHVGPRFSEVDEVEVEFEKPSGEFTGFMVRY